MQPGCWSYRDRCRLYGPLRLQFLVDVTQQRTDVVQLREQRLGVAQRGRCTAVAIGGVAAAERLIERLAEGAHAAPQVVADGAQILFLTSSVAATACVAQLLELLLDLEDVGGERRRHALVVAPERLAVQR